MLQALSKDVKLFKVCNYQAAGSSDTITVNEIDMDGFQHLCVIASLGAVVNTADLTFKLQESATSGSGYTDITDATNSQTNMTNAANSNKALGIDCKKAALRYVNVVLTRSADANITIENCWALLYNGLLCRSLREPP